MSRLQQAATMGWPISSSDQDTTGSRLWIHALSLIYTHRLAGPEREFQFCLSFSISYKCPMCLL
jgi:hypothetical protein